MSRFPYITEEARAAARRVLASDKKIVEPGEDPYVLSLMREGMNLTQARVEADARRRLEAFDSCWPITPKVSR